MFSPCVFHRRKNAIQVWNDTKKSRRVTEFFSFSGWTFPLVTHYLLYIKGHHAITFQMSNWIIVTHMNSDLWQCRFKQAIGRIMKRTQWESFQPVGVFNEWRRIKTTPFTEYTEAVYVLILCFHVLDVLSWTLKQINQTNSGSPHQCSQGWK